MISSDIEHFSDISWLFTYPLWKKVYSGTLPILKLDNDDFAIQLHEFFIYFFDIDLLSESVCNAGDPSSIPGWGRSAGEGRGYALQYSWGSLMAQLVKNLPAMQETWVWSLDWKTPWRRQRLPTPVFWPREFHGLYSCRVRHDGATFTFTSFHETSSRDAMEYTYPVLPGETWMLPTSRQ